MRSRSKSILMSESDVRIVTGKWFAGTTLSAEAEGTVKLVRADRQIVE